MVDWNDNYLVIFGKFIVSGMIEKVSGVNCQLY